MAGTMDDVVNVHEAKTHLSRLLARVEAGEEITLARGGKPIARIVPIPSREGFAGPGAWKGKYDIPDDGFEWTYEELVEMFGVDVIGEPWEVDGERPS